MGLKNSNGRGEYGYMVIHVVKSGESLYSIAQQYGVNYLEVARENEIPVDQSLVVGQTIVLTQAGDTKKLGMIQVNGYAFPNISDEVLEKTLPNLTFLSIFSYNILEDGTLANIEDQDLINKAKDKRVQPVMVISNIVEATGFNSDLVHTILADTAIQDKLIDNVINNMKQKGYEGVDVDFEYVYPYDRVAYNNFLKKLVDACHAEEFFVTTALAPKTFAEQKGKLYEAHDYAFHGNTVDHVIIMTYEWGYTYSAPMAVAPINLVENVIKYAVTDIPSDKIFMGVPNYGYIWKLPYEKGTAAKAIGNYEAVDLARQYNARIEYDEEAQAPFFTYVDENKKENEVWFEDARSIKAKLELVAKYNLAGPSYWTINRFFPQNWLVLTSLFDVEKS